MSARPSPAHHSVIFFPQNEEKPRFEWLKWDKEQNGPTEEELKQRGLKAVKDYTLPGNALLGRHIKDHKIKMITPLCGSPAYKKAPPLPAGVTLPPDAPNQSLAKIDEGMSEWLRGPVMAWGVHHGYDTKKTGSLDLGAWTSATPSKTYAHATAEES